MTASMLSTAIFEPLDDVHPIARLAQIEQRAARDHVAAVVDEVLQRLLERQDLRAPVDDRQHVDAERLLQRRHLLQVVQDDLGDGVLLELDDDAHAVAVGLVADVGDALDASCRAPARRSSRSACALLTR